MAQKAGSYTENILNANRMCTSKQVLVTKDPIFVRKDILEGHYIGAKPPNYMLLSLFLCILNPVCGPLAMLFSVMSDRAYNRGDIQYAEKWGSYALTSCMCVFIFSVVIYIAIGFACSPIGLKGGHSFGV